MGKTSVRLEKIKYTVLASLPEEFLDASIDFSLYDEFFKDEIAVRVRGYVFGERLPDEMIEYPRDWWQAVKERWFPKWALRRFPVVYTVHHINAAILYPGLNPGLPNREWHVDIDGYVEELTHA